MELLAVQLVDCILFGMKNSNGSVFDVCRRIKSTSEWRGIPLIVHAPADTQQAMVDGINAGADDFIVKFERFGGAAGAGAGAIAAETI